MIFKIKNPIFIVGAPHSGTSIMIAILSMLRNVYTFEGESAIFWNKAYHALKTIDNKAIQNGKRRWIEKTPCHIHCIDKMIELFPKCKIIMMIRDGRDVTNSLFKRWNNFENSMNRWIDDNKEGIKHFPKKVNVMAVRYEALIEKTELQLELICDFINEPYQNNLLEYHKKPKLWYDKTIKKPIDKTHKVIRNWQINQPLFDGRNKWKKELDVKLVDKLKNHKEFNLMMKELGYKW